ncbi:hypothetical protein JRQ81_003406, partial [Phrynocephalus forsythii]
AAMLGILSCFSCFLVLVFLSSSPSSSAPADDTVVMTTSGPIKGKRLPAGPG